MLVDACAQLHIEEKTEPKGKECKKSVEAHLCHGCAQDKDAKVAYLTKIIKCVEVGLNTQISIRYGSRVDKLALSIGMFQF